MFKHSIYSLFFLYSLTAIAQHSVANVLDSITTFEQAEAFVKNKAYKQNKIITFNEEKHKTTLAKDLFKLAQGGTKTDDNGYEKTIYKVLEKTKTTNYRASYIVLDGTKLNQDDIKALQQTIIDKYNDGASFNFLAKQYSMDNNAKRGGDTGWFTFLNFDTDVMDIIINDNHDLNAIFTSEVPSKSKYYVILKSYLPKDISEIKVLKIVEAIN